MSSDPTYYQVTKQDIADRLCTRLPHDVYTALEKHLGLILVDLEQDPPQGPWEMAAIIMRLEKTLERPTNSTI